jgi:putative oxidoreductase
MSLASTLLRLTVGGFFVGHGLQKLTGAFDGPGLAGTEQMMAGTGMHPAARNARLVAVTETAGGAALALGAATPLAAAGIVGTMVTAVRKVHLAKGPWVTEGGYEYNAVLIAAAAALASGPGGPSVDQLFGKKSWGAGGTVFALVAGVVASFVAVELGKRATPPTEPDADPSAA